MKLGVGPKAGVLRYLRATRDHGLVALAEDFDAGQFYVLRAASLSAPFDAPISLATPSLSKGHQCGAPLLQVDNTMLMVCSVPSASDRQLLVLRLAAGEVAATQRVIASAEAERPEIVACEDPQRLWVRWGSLTGPTQVFGSKDGGESFVEVGHVPAGGSAMCAGEDLLWVGFNDTKGAQLAHCAASTGSCSAPRFVGGDEVWRSIDGGTLAFVAKEDGFAVLFALGGSGPLHADAYSLFPSRSTGLRNLRNIGPMLFQRVAQP